MPEKLTPRWQWADTARTELTLSVQASARLANIVAAEHADANPEYLDYAAREWVQRVIAEAYERLFERDVTLYVEAP